VENGDQIQRNTCMYCPETKYVKDATQTNRRIHFHFLWFETQIGETVSYFHTSDS